MFLMLLLLQRRFFLRTAVRRAVHDTDLQSVRRRDFRGDALPTDWLLRERGRGDRCDSPEPEAPGLQAHHRIGERNTCVLAMWNVVSHGLNTQAHRMS